MHYLSIPVYSPDEVPYSIPASKEIRHVHDGEQWVRAWPDALTRTWVHLDGDTEVAVEWVLGDLPDPDPAAVPNPEGAERLRADIVRRVRIWQIVQAGENGSWVPTVRVAVSWSWRRVLGPHNFAVCGELVSGPNTFTSLSEGIMADFTIPYCVVVLVPTRFVPDSDLPMVIG